MDFYVFKNNQQVGPFSLMALREKLQKGEFAYTDLAWRDGLKDWTPLKDILGGALPDATPHAVAAPSTSYAAATPGQTPTGARVATSVISFFILFGVFAVIIFILECIIGGIYVAATNTHGPDGQPLTPDQMHDAGQAKGQKYGCLMMLVCVGLSFVVSAPIAWKLGFSNLFPWCRAK